MSDLDSFNAIFNTIFNIFSDSELLLFVFSSLLSFTLFFIFFHFIFKIFYSFYNYKYIDSNDTKKAKNEYEKINESFIKDLEYYGIKPKKEEKLTFYQKLKRKYSKEDF